MDCCVLNATIKTWNTLKALLVFALQLMFVVPPPRRQPAIGNHSRRAFSPPPSGNMMGYGPLDLGLLRLRKQSAVQFAIEPVVYVYCGVGRECQLDTMQILWRMAHKISVSDFVG